MNRDTFETTRDERLLLTGLQYCLVAYMQVPMEAVATIAQKLLAEDGRSTIRSLIANCDEAYEALKAQHEAETKGQSLIARLIPDNDGGVDVKIIRGDIEL